MIDLFGIGKSAENPEPHAEVPEPHGAPEPAPSHGSHRLWAFLLVLDSVFVILFAGTVAAKIYQHWRAPAATVEAPRRRPGPKAEPKAPEAAPEPPKTAEAPKPEPAPEIKHETKSEARPAADAPRPPKPSLLADAPKHRETPAPAPAKPSSAPAPQAALEPGAKVKAAPVEFRLRSPKAKSVQLVGAFIVRGGRKDMSRDGDGVWSVTLYLHPGQYRYFFSVDKKKVLDPENPQTDRGASVLSVP